MVVDMSLDDIMKSVKVQFPMLQSCEIKASDIEIEERVGFSCFYCERYNTNWKCPPNIPKCDYEKLFSEFNNLALVWVEMEFDREEYADVRSESSVLLHKALLDMEKFLLQNGSDIYLSFIGGSCKLCKSGCGKEKCNNPYLARSPLEATGVNVMKLARRNGIDVSFPVENKILRIGLLLW